MAAGHERGALGVARREVLDHRRVVVLDVRPHALHAEAQGDEARHLVEEAGQRPVQAPVPRRRRDRHVEAAVGFEEEVDLVADIHRDPAAAGLFQPFQLRPVHPAGGAPRGEGFQLHPEGEDLIDVLHGDGADPVAVPGHRADEPFLREPLQGDAAARLPDLEPLHHLGLGEAGAGEQAAGDDLPPHQVVGLVGLARRVRDGEHAGRPAAPSGFLVARHGTSPSRLGCPQRAVSGSPFAGRVPTPARGPFSRWDAGQWTDAQPEQQRRSAPWRDHLSSFGEHPMAHLCATATMSVNRTRIPIRVDREDDTSSSCRCRRTSSLRRLIGRAMLGGARDNG